MVERELEEATEKLCAALADKETEADLVSVFRTELMRRVLPQFTEAVRKGVLESIRTRQMHLAQLAVLHRQALDAKTMKTVLTRIDHEVAKAGLQIVGDTSDLSLFNVLEDQPGALQRNPVTFELLVPAYVDKESGKLVERGWLRAVTAEQTARAAGISNLATEQVEIPEALSSTEVTTPALTYRQTLRAAASRRLGLTQRGTR
ncbi:hypothetical protein [Streptomyces wuyuanensis]|uniref:hypothetical protein n=1 Tax=Streptomyces wuyuanensis TaxID=1196353 RepID=UPI0037A846DB